MIKFRDFNRNRENSGGGEYSCTMKLTMEMNQWIENHNIQVVSIETLFEVSGSMASTDTHLVGVRVWYKEDKTQG